jgi:YbbR domain-containing protein
MPEDLAAVEEVSTRPLSIDGIAATTSREARLTLPEGTRLSADVDEVVVTIEVEPVIATRTLLVGVVCRNAGGNLACLPQQDQVAVLVSGPASALADLAAADLSVVVDAGGLDAGEHQLTPNVSLPDGVELESVSPGSVTVLLQAPVTPSPAPG